MDCGWCGAAFTPYKRTSRTCGKQCRVLLNRREQNARHKVPPVEVTCETCGKTYLRPRSDSRHCSPRCRNAAKYSIERAMRITSRPIACAHCGIDISHRRSDAKTCSERCSRRLRDSDIRLRRAMLQHAREARKRRVIVGKGVPVSEWRRILRRALGRCFYCGDQAKLTMDHVVPIIRGGKHSIGNVVAACGSCNSSKNDRLVIEWRRSMRSRP